MMGRHDLKEFWQWIIGIVTSLNTLVIMEYLNFRFHLAENYVLKKDFENAMKGVSDNLLQISQKLDKIWDKVDKKADKE